MVTSSLTHLSVLNGVICVPSSPKINSKQKTKMKKAKYLLLSLSLLFVLSCSKDMKVVKQLDGSWKVTSVTDNGVSVPPAQFENWTYIFTKCKVKKEECDGTATEGIFTLPFKYKVSDKGEKLTITLDILGDKETIVYDIEEHSKTNLKISTVENGEKTVMTLEKK